MTSPQESSRLDAAKLLDTPAGCLERQHSDIAVKAKQFEFQECRTTGLCPLPLFTFILAWRAQCSFDSQEVEGMDKILLEMSR